MEAVATFAEDDLLVLVFRLLSVWANVKPSSSMGDVVGCKVLGVGVGL